MMEYCIYIRQGDGDPYILTTFNNIELAKIKLYDMVFLEELRQRPYFVDNDFYKNRHNANSTRLRYFCIKEREVTEWEKYSEEKEKMKKSVNNKKISFINEYR